MRSNKKLKFSNMYHAAMDESESRQNAILSARGPQLVIPIRSLPPSAPVRLSGELVVYLQQVYGVGFKASRPDLTTGGAAGTPQKAIEYCLQSMIDRFREYSANEEILTPAAHDELRVLRKFFAFYD